MASHTPVLSLGRFSGLKLSAEPSALVGTLILWVLVALAGWVLLGLSLPIAILYGLAAAALHWLFDLCHNLGHAWAARRTGYPMSGIHFWFLFGRSVYPQNEPALPGRVHICRALGGPLVNTALALVALLLALAVRPWQGVLDGLILFAILDNLVLGPGALMPMGFTDGSTILHWWGRK